MTKHVLFVCSGNTCRSPLAEAIARQRAAERGVDVTVASAGTSAWEGSPASDAALLVGLERQLDLTSHRARALTRELVEEADLVLCMASHHVEHALALGGDDKVHLLTDYAAAGENGRAIADPFGGGLDIYRSTVDDLERELSRILERLGGDRASQGTP